MRSSSLQATYVSEPDLEFSSHPFEHTGYVYSQPVRQQLSCWYRPTEDTAQRRGNVIRTLFH